MKCFLERNLQKATCKEVVGVDGGHIPYRADKLQTRVRDQSPCMMLGLGKISTDVRARERLCFVLHFNTDIACEGSINPANKLSFILTQCCDA